MNPDVQEWLMDDRQVFITVVESGGFSAAARRMDATPASISRRIKSLETRLGVRLLQRTTRKVELTVAGERYFSEVRRLLDGLNTLEESLSEQCGEIRGELRVAAPMSFGQRILAPLLARFAARHRDLRINLLLEDAETDLISAGIDVAVRIAYHPDSNFILRRLQRVPRYVCAAPQYLSEWGTPTHPRDLSRHRCLHYNVISEREEWTFRDGQKTLTVPVQGVFCSNNGEVLAEAACQGLGIALLPEFVVNKVIEQGKLVRLLQHHEREPLELCALYPSREHVPTRTRALVAFLVQQFAHDKEHSLAQR